MLANTNVPNSASDTFQLLCLVLRQRSDGELGWVICSVGIILEIGGIDHFVGGERGFELGGEICWESVSRCVGPFAVHLLSNDEAALFAGADAADVLSWTESTAILLVLMIMHRIANCTAERTGRLAVSVLG